MFGRMLTFMQWLAGSVVAVPAQQHENPVLKCFTKQRNDI